MIVRQVGYVQTVVSILALSCACAALADRAVEPQQAAASLAAELFVPSVDDPGSVSYTHLTLPTNDQV